MKKKIVILFVLIILLNSAQISIQQVNAYEDLDHCE